MAKKTKPKATKISKPKAVVKAAPKAAKKTTRKPAKKPAAKAKTTNAPEQEIDPEVLKKINVLRAQVRESFGKIVMAMMMLPRYRHQSIVDLQHLVLEPLIRDRIAIAYPEKTERAELGDLTGMAIWASVSDEVDAKIRDQIKAGTFPIRLGAEEWTSGENNWLLDVMAPDPKSTASVIANFRQLIKTGSLKLHPLVTRLVDKETLEKMGAEKMK